MKKRPSWIAAVTPVVLILALAYAALTLIKSFKADSGAPSSQMVQVGQTLPNYTLVDLQGKKSKLSDFLVPSGKGKVLLLNFWASWCEACIAEMPSINKLRATYNDRGFEVLGINLDEKPEAVVPSSVRKLQMLFPIFVDPEASIADTLDVHAIPFTVVIDSERKILHFQSGDRDWMDTDFRTQLEGWLKATR